MPTHVMYHPIINAPNIVAAAIHPGILALSVTFLDVRKPAIIADTAGAKDVRKVKGLPAVINPPIKAAKKPKYGPMIIP